MKILFTSSLEFLSIILLYTFPIDVAIAIAIALSLIFELILFLNWELKNTDNSAHKSNSNSCYYNSHKEKKKHFSFEILDLNKLKHKYSHHNTLINKYSCLIY